MNSHLTIVTFLLSVSVTSSCLGQITERVRNESWDELVPGARFADRFMPMKGKVLSADTWGADGVLPRWVDNGIEDRIWSYWGGNIIQDDEGIYHWMGCGWLECSEKGHYEWGNSFVFNAIGTSLEGPYRVRDLIGKGHNPEVYQLADGRYVLYVIGGYYLSDDLNSGWQYGEFEFDDRGRGIIEGLSNLSFAQREDGSYLMVCRGGGIWVSEDGLSDWKQVSNGSVYPPVDGRFEDPVIWRDSVQYHLIVNDWYGRIAYYLRSPNGIDWVVDPGEAYMPGIARHADGSVENWFKFERLKVYQDEDGRAIQANFAVIDVLKWEDQKSDNHSSKNISIPLNPGLLMEWDEPDSAFSDASKISLLIKAEPGFSPGDELDIASIRFGRSDAVNYGQGAPVVASEIVGDDLRVSFNAEVCDIPDTEFAPKLIGKTLNGSLVFGFVRSPRFLDSNAILSVRKPVLQIDKTGIVCTLEIGNFGTKVSGSFDLEVTLLIDGERRIIAIVPLKKLVPFEQVEVTLSEPFSGEKETIEEIEISFKQGTTILRREEFSFVEAEENKPENHDGN